MDESQTYHSRRTGRLGLLTVAVALAGAWACGWWRPFRVAVEGESMEPAYRAGDWLIATRRGRIRAGSIVVVEHPQRPGFELIKRVVAGPGDMSRDGRVLGEDEYWIEGDHADRSSDSRTFGSVPRRVILGVVRFRYRWSAGPL